MNSSQLAIAHQKSLLYNSRVKSGPANPVRTNVEFDCEEYYKITFDQHHGYVIGDQVFLYLSYTESELSFKVSVVATVAKVETSLVLYVLCDEIANAIPFALLGKELSEYDFSVSPSKELISVYKEKIKLTMGRDYLISPDNGSNWYSSIPEHQDQYEINLKASAGDFLIKIPDVDQTKLY